MAPVSAGSKVTGLTCRECGRSYPVLPRHVCEASKTLTGA